MKTIGIIGGLGPPSTVKYYEWLNQGVNRRLGGAHTARILLSSVNGADVTELRNKQDSVAEGEFYANEARKLEQAGADFILIASNTSHKNAPAVEAAIRIPLLHLADATARHIRAQGVRRVALLGTQLTMEGNFYRSRLTAAGLEVILPEAADRHWISETIYSELVKGEIRAEAALRFREVIQALSRQKVEGVILGCTELTLLDLQGVQTPLFDTTRIHVEAAIDFALEGEIE
jgi:aspartate racemase